MCATKRVLPLLLALVLMLSLTGPAAAAAENETVSDVTLVVAPMEAGARVDSGVLTAPDGAQYTVHAQHLRLLPFVGAEDALVTYYIGTTSPTLESGHVYALEFWLRANEGCTLGSDLRIAARDTGSTKARSVTWERYTDEFGVETVRGQLTYVVGSVPNPTTVTAIDAAANGTVAPEVGKALSSRFTLTSTPAGGTHKSEVPVFWSSDKPTGAVVEAGHAYYTMSFSILAAEGYRFDANSIRLTLDGSAPPVGLMRLLSRSPSHLSSYTFSYYGIVVKPSEHGTVSAPDYAAGSDVVQLTATPDAGYALAGWVVTDQQGARIEVSPEGTFLMPDPIVMSDESLTLQCVSVQALFSPLPPPENPFTDVAAGQYYYDPVLWAVNHKPQITNGTSRTTFSPLNVCTRGQVVTFLWRAAGEPKPQSQVCPFTDVSPDDYFYSAVLWAVEQGITNGTSRTTFSPNAPCTRAHVVTFLWRAQKEPAAGSVNPFTDVAPGQYYTDAVLWAVSKSITNGTTPTTFSPNAPCTRGQIVTFLYRAQG